MDIRPATDADWPAIWALLHPVFRAGETYAVDPAIHEDTARAYWMVNAHVAVQDRAIVGTYYIKTNQPGGGAHVCNCGYVVAETAQGQGIARMMCEASQLQAAALGYAAMQFNFVLASNVGAVALWHKLGFKTVGTIPDAFDHPEAGMVDAYVMYKVLAGKAVNQR